MATTSIRTEPTTGVGARMPRKEDAPLITGQGRFVDDIKLAGMAHAAFVRSPHASARILSIDTAAARAVPGVVAIHTAESLGLGPDTGVPCASNPTGDAVQPRRPVLAEGVVRMLGEPVAIVVAEERYAARDAADLVAVDYEPLAAVINAEDALVEGAPVVHEAAPDNVCCTIVHKTEGFDPMFEAAPVHVKLTIDNQRLTPVAMNSVRWGIVGASSCR